MRIRVPLDIQNMQCSTHFPGDKNICLACCLRLMCIVYLCLNEDIHLIESRIYIDLFILMLLVCEKLAIVADSKAFLSL